MSDNIYLGGNRLCIVCHKRIGDFQSWEFCSSCFHRLDYTPPSQRSTYVSSSENNLLTAAKKESERPKPPVLPSLPPLPSLNLNNIKLPDPKKEDPKPVVKPPPPKKSGMSKFF